MKVNHSCQELFQNNIIFIDRADSLLVDGPGKQPEHNGLTNFGKVCMPLK